MGACKTARKHRQCGKTTFVTTDPNTKEQVISYIEAALGGDQTAYATLYDQYAPGIYRLCYGLLNNKQDAEDVTQEVFVYAFKNLHRYDAERAAFKTWLYTIAVSRSRNVHRRRRPFSIDLTALLQVRVPAPTSERPEAALARRHAEEAVQRALQSLTPRLREAVVLRYGHGLTYREIASIMGCPQKTAESRVRLAHQHMRNALHGDGQSLLDELLSYR